MTTKITKSSKELKTVLAEKQTALDLALNNFRDLLSVENAKADEIAKARKALSDACDEYNAANIEAVYSGLYEKENPLMAACQYGSMTKKYVVEKSDEHGNVSVSVDDRKTRNAIDLVDFDRRYNGKGTLFKNGQWIYWAEQLAKAIAKDTAKGLEITKEEAKKLAEEYKDAKEAGQFICMTSKSFSKGNIEKDLQSIVDAILYVESDSKEGNALKVTSKDVNYVLARRSKAGKTALSTRCMTGREMLIAIENVMYHLTTGNAYTVDLKK